MAINWLKHFVLAAIFQIAFRNWKLTLFLILMKEAHDDLLHNADLVDSMFDVGFGIVGTMFGELTLRE